LQLELTEDRAQDVSVENEPHSFVFASQNWMSTEDRLLVLIHGSGVVRAGQWARRFAAFSTTYELLTYVSVYNYSPKGATWFTDQG